MMRLTRARVSNPFAARPAEWDATLDRSRPDPAATAPRAARNPPRTGPAPQAVPPAGVIHASVIHDSVIHASAAAAENSSSPRPNVSAPSRVVEETR